MFEEGKLLVQFKTNSNEEQRREIHERIGSQLIKYLPELNIEIVSVEAGKEEAYKEAYLKVGIVESVELDYRFNFTGIPNDPFYTSPTYTSNGEQYQWGLHAINPEPAWQKVKYLNPTIKVAILDTGIDPNHPDLKDKIIDPINFYTSDPQDYIDRTGHGTALAGIVAAQTNNALGVAGTSFNTAYIMPIKVGEQFTSLSAILVGTVYAVIKGAKVINMGVESPVYTQQLQIVIDFAWKQGVVCIAGAGNNASEKVYYPGGHHYVVAAGATHACCTLACFTSWGVHVGVVAPGVDILTTTPTYPVEGLRLNYDVISGTSASAAFVSGVAAMMWAVNPHLTNAQVVQLIEQTATPIRECYEADESNRWSPYYGYGLLNAGEAVKSAMGSSCIQEEGLGSVYGQAVNKDTGIPLQYAPVVAWEGEDKKRVYVTKENVFTNMTNKPTDGMFRLRNLIPGTYRVGIQLSTGEFYGGYVEVKPKADTFFRVDHFLQA